MNDNVSVLQVKLELGEELDEGGVCVSTGSFVMYNCARLATLFSHFEQAVDKGQCSIYYTLYVYIPLNSVLHRAHIYILNISTCPAYYTREWEKQEKEMYVSIFQLVFHPKLKVMVTDHVELPCPVQIILNSLTIILPYQLYNVFTFILLCCIETI